MLPIPVLGDGGEERREADNADADAAAADVEDIEAKTESAYVVSSKR